MNLSFQIWFEKGKVAEALCGQGVYFVPDNTYRDNHDMLFAVRELLNWSKIGNAELAAQGFTGAMMKLSDGKNIGVLLDLLLAYGISSKSTGITLGVEEGFLETHVAQIIQANGELFAKDGKLRNLLLSVTSYFPGIKLKIGLRQNRSLVKSRVNRIS